MTGFSFGGNTKGPPPAPINAAPSSGFPSLNQPVTASTGSVPAASTATNNSNTPAPPTSFSAPMVAQPPTSASVTTGAFSVGNKTSSAATAITNPPKDNALTQQFSMIVPEITEIFPHVLILSEIRRLQDIDSTVEYQRLTAVIKKHHEILSKPPPPSIISLNADKRRQLQSNPNVQLYGREAALTKSMLEEVFHLADTLYIPEEDAMALYAEASQSASREWIQDILQTTLESVSDVAKEHYFLQRRSMVQSILLLCQSRLDGNDGPFSIVDLTDELLQAGLLTNLVILIRKLSELISQLVARQREQKGKTNNPMLETWKHHLQQERQAAVESIFYLTYSTQCTEQEVIDLVDLVQELTNKQNLPTLDPVRDVPDAYHPTPAPQPWTGTFTQALPALQEKNTWEWEQELVKETTEFGDGAILPTVSVLVFAIICALDCRQTLIDRDTHGHNIFGVGNTLFENTDKAIKGPLGEKLKKCGSGWNRKDIWGILSAAYALGLRPIKSVVNSPRTQPVADGIKSTWISCLKAPYEHKSFTCLRLTLLPSIRRHKIMLDERCELYEFSMSVLSDFTSLYLDVLCASTFVPNSRANWEDSENEKLQWKREEQESERSFHNAYKEGTYKAKEDLRSEANLAERPDCIDDIMAFATALCNRGQKFAAYFWSRDGDKVVPSRALHHLELQLGKDHSLIPTHLSFLSALAMAEPSEVFNILNKEAARSDETVMNWRTIFTTIRWYVREMGDSHTAEVKLMQKDSPSVSLSTSYYYGVDDDENRSAENSRSSARQSNVRNRLKELDEGNTAIILSHLAVITKVANNYGAGRACLVNLKLSLEDALSKDESDSVLVVLFLLGIAPVTPHVRGSVFATIASLLSVDSEMTVNEKKVIQEAAREGWNLLELTQAVPVLLFDQYQRNDKSLINPKMTFPPSSIPAENNVASSAQLPADSKYGIVFEMEHVESHLGFYPSTEGLLQLLLSLVKVSGCPHMLGQEQRHRTGCAPYIEYVVNFVLPRALNQLPFKTGVDSARLIARALAVVEAVLIRYTIPNAKDLASEGVMKHQRNLDAAVSLLGICDVANEVMMIPLDNDINCDFGSKQTNAALSEHAETVPRLKSPGFLILADLLAASESVLLPLISNVLTRDGGSDGVNKIYGFADLQYRVTWARFGNTKPSVFSATHKQKGSPSLAPQSLLTQLLPPIDIAVGPNDSLDPIHWRATGILSSLRILAAAAVREQDFINILGSEARFVPALQFTAAEFKMVQKKEIRLVCVKNSITGINSPETRFLSALSQYLKPICSSESKDTALSGSALAVLFYSFMPSNVEAFLSALDAQSIHGELHFAAAVAERLAIACKRISCKVNIEIVNLLLLLVQSPLSNVLLGFPHKCVDGLRTDGVLPLKYHSKHTECLSVFLDCLSNDDFMKSSNSSELASKIFQTIVCLSTSNNDDSSIGKIQADHLRKRLDDIDFWTNTSRQFLAFRESGETFLLQSVTQTHRQIEGAENIVRGAAWLCDGLAHHFVKNLQNINNKDALSQRNQNLLSNLLDKEYHLLHNALDCLPIRNDVINMNFPTALLFLQHTIEECMYTIDDKSGYRFINIVDLEKKIRGVTDDALSEGVKWAKHWNQSKRWEHAIFHLSSAISNLIEACLEYSGWILKSGISNLLHNSGEINIARDENLFLLLDKISGMLINHHDNRMEPSAQLSEPVLMHLSTEVLMLVERALSSTQYRSKLSYFIKQIGNATIASLQCSKSRTLTIDDEERAILLGTALCKLLKTKKIEHHDNQYDMIKHVAAAFGNLSCRIVRTEKCSELEMRQSDVSMVSRSILCSLVESFDTVGSGETNEVVTSLACTLSTPCTQLTILQTLVQLIPKLDSNICLLLEALSCCEGGARSLLKTGLLVALLDASEKFRKIEQIDMRTIEDLHTSGWVTFFTSNLTLLRSLLATLPSRENEMECLHNALLKLIISYRVIVFRVASSFPKYGQCWLDIVQSLATLMTMKNNSGNQLQFRNSSLGNNPSDSNEFGQIIGVVGNLTEKIIQFPFPGRQPNFPRQIQEQPISQDSWWDALDQKGGLNDSNDGLHLRSPPTGCFTDDGVTSSPWTRRKYEFCTAGAQVMDASLTILIQMSAEKNDMKFDTAALARGLIRLSDCSKAAAVRLRDIEEKLSEGSNSMCIRGSDEYSKETVALERGILEELCPLFGRIFEKLLILSHSIYRNMKFINEEFCGGVASNASPDMQKFQKFVLLAIQYTGLAENSVLYSSNEAEGSELAMLLARRLKEELEVKE